MPDINIGVKVSGGGAIGQLSAIQGAIDSITGKSVKVKVEVEGGAALSRAVGNLEKLGMTAGKASQGAEKFSGSAKKAQENADKLGERAQRAAGHVERLGGTARNAGNDVDRLGESAAGAQENVEKLGEHSARAAAAQQELGEKAERAGAATERSTGSATRAVSEQAEAVKQVGQHVAETAAGVEDLNKGLGKTADAMKSFRSGPLPARGSSQQYPSAAIEERMGQIAEEQAAGGSRRGGRGGSSGSGGSRRTAEGLEEVGKAAERSGHSVMGLERVLNQAQNAGWQLSSVGGMMAGVAGESVHLAKSTAALGMNFEGLGKGIQQAAWSAAHTHDLGLSGLDGDMRNHARTMANDLAPAIKSSIGAVKAIGDAGMGAWGSLGSNIEQFSNTASQNAPAIQSMMHSIGSSVLSLGTDVVAGVAQSAPAFAQLANTVAKDSPQITDAAKAFGNFLAGAGEFAANTTAVATDIGHGIQAIAGGGPNADTYADPMGKSLFGKPISFLSAHPQGTQPFSPDKEPTAPGGGSAPVKSGGFDPNKPYSGLLPDGHGGFTPGSGDGGKPKSSTYSPSHDSDWAKGMTGAQAYEHQRAAAGLGKEGAPAWDGLAGHIMSSAGSKVQSSDVLGQALQTHVQKAVQQAAPAATAGGASISSAVTSGAAEHQAQSSSSTGQAIENHVQKAVHQASPAASAGGASLGGAVTGGAAQGITTTQTVTDTAIIKHLKKVLDMASGPGGIDAHSPSRKYDYLGRLIPQGLAQGIEADSDHTFGAMNKMLTAQEDMASKYAPGYDGSTGVTVSIRKSATQANADDAAAQQAAANPAQNQAMQYSSQLANANIEAHNARAAALATGREELQRQAIGGMTHDERRDQILQNRANNHERALANLGVPGHSDPSQNANPFAGDQHQSLWNTIKNQGPMGDLKAAYAAHGESMAKGVSIGVAKGAPAAQNQMAGFARGMQNVHRKTHGIESPSTVFMSDGLNIAAGAASGVTAGTPMAVAAVSGMSSAMQTAGGWLSDRGLMVGYSWAQNVLTGANLVIKNADYKALGLPNLNSPMAQMALGQQGFLVAGSGAESYKMPDGSSGVVTFGGGTPANKDRTYTFNHVIDISGTVHSITTDVVLDHLGELKDAVTRQSH